MNPAFLAGLLLLVLASGCATREVTPNRAVPIGRELSLNLPAPPGYPRETTVLQTVQGAYDSRRVTFQSVISLAADAVRVIITLPGGPRVMTIDWSAQAVTTDRSSLAPAELTGENVLADMVISLWDPQAVRAALPEDAEVSEADGVRTIRGSGRDIVTVRYSGDGSRAARMVLTNHDFGYELVITSQRIDGI